MPLYQNVAQLEQFYAFNSYIFFTFCTTTSVVYYYHFVTTTTTTTTKSQWSVPSIRGLIKHQIEYRGGANGVMR